MKYSIEISIVVITLLVGMFAYWVDSLPSNRAWEKIECDDSRCEPLSPNLGALTENQLLSAIQTLETSNKNLTTKYTTYSLSDIESKGWISKNNYTNIEVIPYQGPKGEGYQIILWKQVGTTTDGLVPILQNRSLCVGTDCPNMTWNWRDVPYVHNGMVCSTYKCL